MVTISFIKLYSVTLYQFQGVYQTKTPSRNRHSAKEKTPGKRRNKSSSSISSPTRETSPYVVNTEENLLGSQSKRKHPNVDNEEYEFADNISTVRVEANADGVTKSNSKKSDSKETTEKGMTVLIATFTK